MLSLLGFQGIEKFLFWRSVRVYKTLLEEIVLGCSVDNI